MIHEIIIENFFSIAEKQTIDFRVPRNAPDVPNFRASRSDPDVRLPVVVGFFGPNASGKSTVLRAITATAEFVANSFFLPPKGIIPNFLPYLHKDWIEKPTKLTFIFDGISWRPDQPAPHRYELHIERTSETIVGGLTVAYESLSIAPQGRWRNIFKREGQNFKFGSEFDVKESDSRIEGIRPNASTISTMAQLNHELSKRIVEDLRALQTNIVGFSKTQDSVNQWLNFFTSNKNYLDSLNRDLRRLDLGLEEMQIMDGQSGKFASFIHTGLDFPVPLDLESQGTHRFIEKFPRIQYALDTGGVIVLDEFDNDIHPQVIPEILGWFADRERNKHNAQLILAAHNLAMLDELEKQQIFFTVKKNGRPTEVYGASEIRGLRREPSLMKKYLAGELGALPVIG